MLVREAAARWRDATTDRDREEASSALWAAVRHRAFSKLAAMQALDEATREDIAQSITPKLVAWIQGRKVDPGAEDGFVAVCASNAGTSHLRRERRRAERLVVIDPDSPDPIEQVASADPDAPTRLEEKRLQDTVRAALDAPELLPRQREMLSRVYVRGEDIGALVREDLERRGLGGVAPGSPEFVKTRWKIDKALGRARLALRIAVLRAVDPADEEA
jgi:DNA-directed RNA polymerase specialized sigma24 family protein